MRKEKTGRLPEAVARHYTRQVLEGLAHLHAHQIVHRDVKAANVLVDAQGNVKLGDFSAAKRIRTLSLSASHSYSAAADADGNGTSSVVGTPFWMAPEVIQGRGHTFASDIWCARSPHTHTVHFTSLEEFGMPSGQRVHSFRQCSTERERTFAASCAVVTFSLCALELRASFTTHSRRVSFSFSSTQPPLEWNRMTVNGTGRN